MRLQSFTSIQENFKENLETTNAFKETKGLLSNMSDYFTKNKTVLYSLLTATAINALSTLAPVYEQLTNNEKPAIETVIEKKVNNDIGFETPEFMLKQIELSLNRSKNMNSINIAGKSMEIVELNKNFMDRVQNLSEGETITIENPFWKGSPLHVGRHDNHEIGSHYSPYGRADHGGNIDGEVMIYADHAANTILMDFNQTDLLLNLMQLEKTTENADFAVQWVMAHEAAHGSYQQGMHFKSIAEREAVNITYKEMHSDVSALMYVANKNNYNLKEFNQAADSIINMRNNDELSFNYQQSYGLIEFKNFINKNPDLLQMSDKLISPFSEMVVRKMEGQKFKMKDIIGYDVTQKEIFENIMANKNMRTYHDLMTNFNDNYDGQLTKLRHQP